MEKILKIVKYKCRAKLSLMTLNDHLQSLNQNQISRRQHWKFLIKMGQRVELNAREIEKELQGTYLCVGYNCSVTVEVGKTRSVLWLYRKNKLVKMLCFFNNDYPVILQRFQGFIGLDSYLMQALLQQAQLVVRHSAPVN